MDLGKQKLAYPGIGTKYDVNILTVKKVWKSLHLQYFNMYTYTTMKQNSLAYLYLSWSCLLIVNNSHLIIALIVQDLRVPSCLSL